MKKDFTAVIAAFYLANTAKYHHLLSDHWSALSSIGNRR